MSEISRTCLKDLQVLQCLGKDSNDKEKLKWSIQAGNNVAVAALVRAGFGSELLRATFNLQRAEEGDALPITVQGTVVRQRLLAKARTAGARHHATGGCHLTEDDILIGIEMAS